jgi:hypothetical protein
MLNIKGQFPLFTVSNHHKNMFYKGSRTATSSMQHTQDGRAHGLLQSHRDDEATPIDFLLLERTPWSVLLLLRASNPEEEKVVGCRNSGEG